MLGARLRDLDLPGNAHRGILVETFVLNELVKLLSATESDAELHHFRDRDGHEIDFLIESSDGRVAAIEVKAASSVSRADLKHMLWLRERLGDRFTTGIVLYLGQHSVTLGDGMMALPLSVLWGHAGSASEL